MKRIEFKITFAEGQDEIVAVFARDINSGARKALALALKGVSSTNPRWEFARLEFWQVTS